MSLAYILDGYNIIKQIPAFAFKNLQSGRESLVSLIEIYRPQGSRKNSVTIVFDGKPGIISPQNPTSVKIIFAASESADDRIRRLVEASSRRKQIVVVTDDRELGFSLRALNAGVLGVKEFLARTKKDKAEASARQDEGKNIPQALMYQITDELEKIWLGKGPAKK